MDYALFEYLVAQRQIEGSLGRPWRWRTPNFPDGCPTNGVSGILRTVVPRKTETAWPHDLVHENFIDTDEFPKQGHVQNPAVIRG